MVKAAHSKGKTAQDPASDDDVQSRRRSLCGIALNIRLDIEVESREILVKNLYSSF